MFASSTASRALRSGRFLRRLLRLALRVLQALVIGSASFGPPRPPPEPPPPQTIAQINEHSRKA